MKEMKKTTKKPQDGQSLASDMKPKYYPLNAILIGCQSTNLHA
jgi:hypothetical protein